MPNKIILVVEDEKDVAKLLVKRLTTQGFNVLVASDAYQGTALIIKERPDLVILDLMLPAGGGLSVLKNVKNNASAAFIPIVVLTGVKDDQIKKEVINAGVDAYIEKPYESEALITTINGILDKKE